MSQLAQELILTGQRVVPESLLEKGFAFQDTEIKAFLRRLFER